jgi:hypothetical protein
MCHSVVMVASDDVVYEPGRNVARHLHDLGIRVTGRRVSGIIELRAAATGMRGNYDNIGSGLPEFLRFCRDGPGEWGDRETRRVR